MAKSESKELLTIKYNSLGDRKRHFDSLFWQIPSLSLGGQAFLLSIALNSSTHKTEKILAAVLGVFIAFVSLASLSRIRLYEFTITNMLIETEHKLFGYSFTDTESSEWSKAQKQTSKGKKKKIISQRLFSVLHPVKSYEVWVITLLLFILVGLYIIVSTII